MRKHIEKCTANELAIISLEVAEGKRSYSDISSFKGMGELRCSYCPENANPEEVVYHADLKIHTHPDNPNKVVVVCDSYNCSQAHLKRFQRNLA